jgi:hypothetical protein
MCLDATEKQEGPLGENPHRTHAVAPRLKLGAITIALYFQSRNDVMRWYPGFNRSGGMC